MNIVVKPLAVRIEPAWSETHGQHWVSRGWKLTLTLREGAACEAWDAMGCTLIVDGYAYDNCWAHSLERSGVISPAVITLYANSRRLVASPAEAKPSNAIERGRSLPG